MCLLKMTPIQEYFWREASGFGYILGNNKWTTSYWFLENIGHSYSISLTLTPGQHIKEPKPP